MKSLISAATISIKDAVCVGLLRSDLRMIVSWLVWILNEKFCISYIESLTFKFRSRIWKCYFFLDISRNL